MKVKKGFTLFELILSIGIVSIISIIIPIIFLTHGDQIERLKKDSISDITTLLVDIQRDYNVYTSDIINTSSLIITMPSSFVSTYSVQNGVLIKTVSNPNTVIGNGTGAIYNNIKDLSFVLNGKILEITIVDLDNVSQTHYIRRGGF